MRIISKFKDYYDGVCNSYDEKDIIYIREEKSYPFIPTQADRKVFMSHNFTVDVYYAVMQFQIELYPFGFCGKFYVMFKNSNNFYSNIDKLIDSYLESATKPRRVEISKQRKRIVTSALDQSSRMLTALDAYNIFDLHNCLYFRLAESQNNLLITTDFDSLAKFNFFQLLDANSTYQELEMYLGTVMVREQQPSQITDNKILLQSKGFDIKTSFRHPVK